SARPLAVSGPPGAIAESLGCEKQARQGRRERSYREGTGATEDAAWRRLSRARGRRMVPGGPLDRNRRVLECVLDELVGGQARRARFRRQHQAVREHGLGDRLDVVGLTDLAPGREGAGLRAPQQRDAGPRARADVKPLVLPGLAQEGDHVAVDALFDEDRASLVDEL